MAAIGPVVLATQGDQYRDGARILAVIWLGATTAGDSPILRCRRSGALLWQGWTDGTHTYQGANFSPSGLHAPHGFAAASLPSGKLLVYLLEG